MTAHKGMRYKEWPYRGQWQSVLATICNHQVHSRLEELCIEAGVSQSEMSSTKQR